MEDKRILILGATGAMAVYLIPELLARGYRAIGAHLKASKGSSNFLQECPQRPSREGQGL